MEINELYELYQQSGKISTDSRHVEPGSLFFALKGDRFNGNHFAGQALEAGAAYASVDEPEALVPGSNPVPDTQFRAHETKANTVIRLLL